MVGTGKINWKIESIDRCGCCRKPALWITQSF